MQYYEAQELAALLLGFDYDTLADEGREDEIEEALYEKFEIGMEQFCDIVSALLPYTPVVRSAFLKKDYNAFVNPKEGVMIVKREVKEK